MQLRPYVKIAQLIFPGLVLMWVVLGLAGSFTAEAQGSGGEISGKIVDNTGAILPGVTVVVTNQETGLARTLVSNEAGRYIDSNLPPGPYELRAELPGFQSVVQRNLQVTVGSHLSVDFEMAIGEFAEAVEVVSETPMVDISSSSIGGVVSRESIENLPLNSRSYDQLMTLQAGVVLAKNQNRSFQGGNTTKVSIRGARSDQNKLLLDGTDVRGITGELPGSVAGTSLGVDAVREFQVEVGTYAAEHGGAAGGVINVVTKSGTNRFSGTAFEFHRNDALDEVNYFDEGEQPPFERNQFGFSFGGPIRRNKAFFFANVEALRENLGMTLRPVVPTAAARQGVLPTGTVTVSPQITPYLELYPLPNGREFGDGTAEYVHEAQATTNQKFAVVRYDQSLSEKQGIFGRYTFDQADQSSPEFFARTPIVANGRNQYLTVEHNYILSSSLVNAFSFGLNRTYQRQAMVADYPTSQLEALAWVPGRELLNESSLLTVTGISNLGDSSDPRTWIFTFPQWKDTLSWSKGSHQIKGGFAYSLLIQDITNEVFNGGAYDFSSLTQFLTNRPTRFQLTSTKYEPGRVWKNSYIAWFVQDQYRATDRVTLDLGFRHEVWTGPSDEQGRCANLVNDMDPASTEGCPFWETQAKNFMPRVGVAWDVTGTGSTAIRSGFGIFYDSMTAGQWWTPGESQLPYAERGSQNNPPFPNGIDTIGLGPIPVTSPAPLTLTGVPHTMQFSFSAQRLIGSDFVVEVGYAGGRSRNNWVRGDMNQRVPTILADGTKFFDPATPRRRNPNFGEIRRHQTVAEGDYNGFLLSAKKRLSDGLQFQGSYTWSKSMDVASGTAQPKATGSQKTSVMDAYDIFRDRGPSDFNATHNFVVNGVWEVPTGGDLTGVAAVLLEGWQIAGVFTMITGSPVNIVVGFNRSQTGSTGSGMHERPNLAEGADQNPVLGNPDQWYDPLAFVLQPAGYFGNLGKNTVTGPNLRTLDLSFSKMTSLVKGTRLQLRFEFFNLLNRANFGQPSDVVFSATGRVGSAGQITSTSTAARQMQLGAKLIW